MFVGSFLHINTSRVTPTDARVFFHLWCVSSHYVYYRKSFWTVFFYLQQSSLFCANLAHKNVLLVHTKGGKSRFYIWKVCCKFFAFLETFVWLYSFQCDGVSLERGPDFKKYMSFRVEAAFQIEKDWQVWYQKTWASPGMFWDKIWKAFSKIAVSYCSSSFKCSNIKFVNELSVLFEKVCRDAFETSSILNGSIVN